MGSILQPPFPDSLFDYVVAIGSYHYTGKLQKAIDESHRVLRPGGRLIFMVYNGFSYRQWHSDLRGTLRHLFASRSEPSSPGMRAAYDQSNGNPAPHTDFVSRSRLRRMCRAFRRYEAQLENITSEPPFKRSRAHLLRSFWPRIVGLDIYATAVK
jgi:SAM-dependent methyltransferase